MYSEETGDLFDIRRGAIGHGCNIVGVMGAGVAWTMQRRYPAMYRQYVKICRSGQFPLGAMWMWHDKAEDRVIYNLATQMTPGPCASLGAISVAVQAMLNHARFHRIPEVAIPRIGVGLGGLDWSKVRPVLQEQADRFAQVQLVVVTIPEVDNGRTDRTSRTG